ncbi:hypothetical protein ACFFUB_11075 [Algimonas porphyrae]|uniref:Uncharacterized protein n=1 Tax=Algimonas porphyrae TaxID=1128113 RepID=A0ABQ5V301_9PROT|nr:hypothetical protein [Algimonas porphyrae]GLQ21339.1 hypothetical protein GCM10007854_22940 [Algimonas porphyrae]
MTKQSGTPDKPTRTEAETLAYLVAQAEELSELALKSGKPEASALFTLALSDLRKKAG